MPDRCPYSMTVQDAAAALGVHRNTITRLVLAGKLRAVNVGSGSRRHLRLSADDITAFIARAELGGAA